MSEERFDRLEKMLELALKEITTVKSIMPTKEDIADLNSKVNSLDSRVVSLDSKVDLLDSKLLTLDSKVDSLDAKAERYGQAQQEDVYGLLQLMDKKLTDLSEDIKSIVEVTGEHEIRIRTLARRPV